MTNCLFCNIIKKEIPAEIQYEDETVFAFSDNNPLAPIHILIIPRNHIQSINDLREEDAELIGKMILTAKKLAKEKGIAEDGYKLLFRTGKNGGQEIEHIHLHLIGGAKLREDIGPIFQ